MSEAMRRFNACAILLFATAFQSNDCAFAGDSDRVPDVEIKGLIDKAVAARNKATASIRSASGRGSYKVKVTDLARRIATEERASFQMARSDPKQFIHFRYEDGAGHEAPDVYARVVLSDGRNVVFESKFCQRIRPTGAEAMAYKQFEPGTIQPCVWISGNLAQYYGAIDRLEGKLTLRDEDGIKVVTGSNPGVESEFWIDPSKESHIIRYRQVTSRQTTEVGSVLRVCC
jgi:hypothetical protein